MINKEHRLDTIAWLIITVVCMSALAVYMVSDNLNLKREKYRLEINIKKCEQQIDSLETIEDSLRNEIETVVEYCEESFRLHEDEISFLGHELDRHNIQPDYSNLGR